jgi:RNA polymerase sigma-70 factor (sigma-E family)
MRTTMAGYRSRVGSEPGSADADAGVEQIYRAQRLVMVRLALLLVDDRETAQDVVQDAFLALRRRWGSLRSEDAAVGYLRSCVMNGARSVLRRRRTVRRHPWSRVDLVTEAPADEAVLLAEGHRHVLRALGTLPDRQREVIVLRYWSQLTEPEIAATLGISIGAVKSMASRGRSAIAAELGVTS